jgi:hypothetical protein
MTADVYPLQVLLVTLAGWINRHQQHVIEYLVEGEPGSSLRFGARPMKNTLDGRSFHIRFLTRPARTLVRGRLGGAHESPADGHSLSWSGRGPCAVEPPTHVTTSSNCFALPQARAAAMTSWADASRKALSSVALKAL